MLSSEEQAGRILSEHLRFFSVSAADTFCVREAGLSFPCLRFLCSGYEYRLADYTRKSLSVSSVATVFSSVIVESP